MTAGGRILIVDDEAQIRRFLRASLDDAGYRVSEATTAKEGLREAISLPPDLIILDLGLPDLDGQEVLKQLREWYHAPVIILSARAHEGQKVLALDQGADDYVTKPFSIGELLARVRVALRHSQHVSPDSTSVRIGDLQEHIGMAWTGRAVGEGERAPTGEVLAADRR